MEQAKKNKKKKQQKFKEINELSGRHDRLTENSGSSY